MSGPSGPSGWTRETWSTTPPRSSDPDGLLAERVLAAVRDWRFVPDDAQVREGEGYLLVEGPDWWSDPLELTLHGVGAAPRPVPVPAPVLLAEALDRAAATGRSEVVVRVGLEAPEEMVDLLLERGATLVETCSVLALDLAGGVPDLDVPAGLEVRWVGDPEGMAAHHAVNTAVFGGTAPPRWRGVEEAAQATVDHRHGYGGVVLVGRRDEVVGSAAITRAGHVSRLWGGAVLPEARGSGCYRALLRARLEFGLAHGAPLALVRARVESSGPILARIGFTAHGQEQSFAVPLTR